MEIFDIEDYAREGKTVPKGRKYRIKVDNQKFVVPEKLTGAEILQIAGKTPVQKYQLNQRMKGGVVTKVDYNQTVDFTVPGIEKFMTIPLDQTEG